jgi:N-acetylglucosaminyldiphosphoundecaprenol N-acetyl-beta-D-mannosaminyltransferase
VDSDLEAANLLGVRVCTLPVESFVNFVTRTILAGGKARAVYVNTYAINLAQEFTWFRDFINSSDVIYCDGFGVKWGARLLGLRIPTRYTPPDWIPLLVAKCARQQFSLYLLGAHPGVAEKVGVILKQQFSDLNIAGVHHGYFDKTPDSLENEAVVQAINATSPDILLVGLGMPLQERWLMENWDCLEVKVFLPVGALFDYLAGEFPRAPHWMTDHGLEWLGRLIVEPRRLWRRYLLGTPRFLWLLLKQRLGLMHAK